MSAKTCLIAAGVLAAAAPMAAQAQGYYGYGDLPPPPYAYAGEAPAYAPAACSDQGFTLLGAHAGVTVLGFGLNAGANFTAPADCGGYGSGEGYAPQFTPRPYAPPPAPPVAYAPPAYGGGYGYGYSRQGYPPPCGCETPGW